MISWNLIPLSIDASTAKPSPDVLDARHMGTRINRVAANAEEPSDDIKTKTEGAKRPMLLSTLQALRRQVDSEIKSRRTAYNLGPQNCGEAEYQGIQIVEFISELLRTIESDPQYNKEAKATR